MRRRAEAADWLLAVLGLRRTPVLRWGPRGMQRLGAVRRGRSALLGLAGDSAPDHLDHLHARPEPLACALDGWGTGRPRAAPVAADGC